MNGRYGLDGPDGQYMIAVFKPKCVIRVSGVGVSGDRVKTKIQILERLILKRNLFRKEFCHGIILLFFYCIAIEVAAEYSCDKAVFCACIYFVIRKKESIGESGLNPKTKNLPPDHFPQLTPTTNILSLWISQRNGPKQTSTMIFRISSIG
jgi:hypothetical protein